MSGRHGQVGGSGRASLTDIKHPGHSPRWCARWPRLPSHDHSSSLVRGLRLFDAAHGWGVNLFLVVSLAVLGLAFLSGRPTIVRPAVIAGVVVCLADWVFIEDFGFLGGVGTDPNSMIPMALVFIAGYLALTRIPARMEAPVPIETSRGASPSLRERLAARPTYTFRAASCLCAIGIVLIGAAPIALASTNPNSDPIVSQAFDGTPNAVDYPGPAFSLVDQRGHEVSTGQLARQGRHPVVLGPRLVLQIVLSSPRSSRSPIRCSGSRGSTRRVRGRRHQSAVQIAGVPHGIRSPRGTQQPHELGFLTGSTAGLQRVWAKYGVQVYFSTGGAMIAHNDLAYVIHASGNVRYILDILPGPGTQTTRSSTSVVVSKLARSELQP